MRRAHVARQPRQVVERLRISGRSRQHLRARARARRRRRTGAADRASALRALRPGSRTVSALQRRAVLRAPAPRPRLAAAAPSTATPASTPRTMRASARSSTRPLDAGCAQRIERQLLHLEVGLEPGVAVDLGAELQRLARRVRRRRPRVQHRAAIAQARHALAVEQVGVDARHLRRGVGAHAERAAAQLIDQLEGLQIQLAPGARQQRLQVLEQRRHHQLEAVAARQVEQRAAQLLDAPRLRGQHIGNVLGQQPGRRHETSGPVKNGIVRVAPWSAPAVRLAAEHAAAAAGPTSMLDRPRKRIWPSLMRSALLEHLAPGGRAQERQQALDHQHQRHRAEQQVASWRAGSAARRRSGRRCRERRRASP